MVEDPAPEDVDAFLEGIRRWFVEDQGFLDVDALLESLDMTMEEFDVVAQQEGLPEDAGTRAGLGVVGSCGHREVARRRGAQRR